MVITLKKKNKTIPTLGHIISLQEKRESVFSLHKAAISYSSPVFGEREKGLSRSPFMKTGERKTKITGEWIIYEGYQRL